MPPPITSSRSGMSAEVERAGRVHDARVLVRDAGQLDRARAGGDDRVVEGDRARAVLARDLEHVRAGEARLAADDADLARLRHPRQPAGQLADDRSSFHVAQRVEVDLRRAERDAVLGQRLRLGDHLRDVQQRLRRDAADVEADAAEHRVALDHHDVEAEVGGAERRRVAAGPGAQHEHARRARRRARTPAGAGGAACAARRRPRRVHVLAPPSAVLAARRRRRRASARLRPASARRAASRPRRRRPAVAGRPRSPRRPSPRRPCRRPRRAAPCTVPACGAGISIEALSDSSTTSGWSAATSSPAATSTSTTGHVGVVADVRDDDLDRGAHSSTRRMSPSTPARWAQKRAAAAPSITRWS